MVDEWLKFETAETALAALEELHAANPTEWPWRYRWRTYRDGEHWAADVNAGHMDENWRRIIGGTPCWKGKGTTEEAALIDAAEMAVNYWRWAMRSNKGLN
jgi:hypothetical protein